MVILIRVFSHSKRVLCRLTNVPDVPFLFHYLISFNTHMDTATKTPTSNVSFNHRELSAFRQMENELMRKTRQTKSAVYKQGLQEYYFKHFPHIR